MPRVLLAAPGRGLLKLGVERVAVLRASCVAGVAELGYKATKPRHNIWVHPRAHEDLAQRC